ncbi:piggyBac transposable element-derived protein 3 [Trichonephila clavipes]|uniref:PiggyBac transposable element-derived protein 3 n=1 Tax=Trichonephila clavipes TaxID=2585209 RepID=A0A8X6RXC3_TRICX|nr:piggyBac transposable element-derived protein 3 [Trichonephila clavipes]
MFGLQEGYASDQEEFECQIYLGMPKERSERTLHEEIYEEEKLKSEMKKQEIALNDGELIDTCQLPPEESGCFTDEQDIDKDIFPSVLPADVCGKIEISTNIHDDEISHEGMFDAEEPSTSKGMSNLERKLKSIKEVLNFVREKKEYVLHLANMTGLYAMQKEDFSVDENDIELFFFGNLLFSGYHQVPGEDLYSSTQEDLSVPIVSTVMPRKRENFFHSKLSMNESMVPYYGHHSAKMFIKDPNDHLNPEVVTGLYRYLGHSMKPKIHSVPRPHTHSSKRLRQSDAHYLVPSTQGRCAVCQKNTVKKYLECEIRLHEKCFPNYHRQ